MNNRPNEGTPPNVQADSCLYCKTKIIPGKKLCNDCWGKRIDAILLKSPAVPTSPLALQPATVQTEGCWRNQLDDIETQAEPTEDMTPPIIESDPQGVDSPTPQVDEPAEDTVTTAAILEARRVLEEHAAVTTGVVPSTDPIPGLTEGRIVHYVISDGPSVGQHRPAIVVRVWNPTATDKATRGCVQLQVFTDGPNDQLHNTEWRSSVTFDDSPTPAGYTWHWPERA